MKIISMKCPQCQGNLDIKEDQMGKFTTCPYCGTKFLLEEEKPNINQTFNIKELHIGDTGRSSDYNRKTAPSAAAPLAVIFCIIGAVFIIFVPQILRSTSSYDVYSDNGSTAESKETAASPFVTYRTKPESKAVIDFVEAAFKKPLSDIKKADYESIKYLKVDREAVPITSEKNDSTPWIFTYAKNTANYGAPDKPVKLKIAGTKNITEEDFQVFTELETLDFSNEGDIVPAGDSYDTTDFKNLKKLHYYTGTSSEYLTHMPALNVSNIYGLGTTSLYDIEKSISALKTYKNLKMLNFTSLKKGEAIKDLSFLSSFPNVEILSLDFAEKDTWDLAGITSLTKLKSLSINGYDTTFEHFNVFSGIPQIESLTFKNVKDLKTLDFVKNMPYLKSLSIDSCPVIKLNGLKNCISLTSLTLDSCGDLTDVSALATLKSLKKLSISGIWNYNITFPNLSKLTALSDVDIRARDLSIISGMSSIKRLEIEDIGNESYSFKPVAGMNNLEELTLYDYDWLIKPDMAQYLSKLPKLRTINFGYGSIAHYGDYTDVFALPQVTKIVSFSPKSDGSGINYIILSVKSLRDNKVLKELDLSGTEIYNNDVDKGGTDKFGVYANKFLSHFPNLRKLNLANTYIENLDFVDKMPLLEELNISGNYVTDVSKLLKLKKLKKLTCDTDMIKNLDLLPKSVKVNQ